MTTRRITALGTAALAAAVATIAACHTGGSPLGEDKARALLAGILDMANDAPLGTHSYACPFGGEAETTVEVTTGQRGDTAYTTGRWELEFPWSSSCRLAEGYPSLELVADIGGAFNDPEEEDIFFMYETAVLESGARRLRALVEGEGDWHDWETGESGGPQFPCVFYHIPPGKTWEWTKGGMVFESEKEAGDDSPFTGSLVGTFCFTDMEIPLSDFPSTDRLLSSRQ